MCGRFVLDHVFDLFPRFKVEGPRIDLSPRYNIAPGQAVPIIVSESPNQLVLMQWGLVPFWAKDPAIGNKMINARAEGIESKPAFRSSIKHKRCLVPATAFYEWKKEDHSKTPYLFKLRSGETFSFAGLYDHWSGADGSELLSFTIITTRANDAVSKVHDRMPVILRQELEDRWLEHSTIPSPELERLLSPLNPDEMEFYSVSRKVNDAHVEGPDLIRPVERRAASLEQFT